MITPFNRHLDLRGSITGLFKASLMGCAAIVLLISGCSDNRAHVTGRVTLDGQPLTTGLVATTISGSRGSSGKIQSDGSFRLSQPVDGPGAVVGKHTVSVVAMEGGISDEEDDIDAPPKQTRSLLPRRYSSPKTSGLTINVERGGNEVLLELTSEP